jgi:aspartyl protease family protein
MAIGFISGSWGVKLRNSIAALAFGLTVAVPAAATDVTVVGLSSTRASVSINGGAPRWLAVGQRSPEGVLLVAADRESATFEIDAKRRVLKMNQAYVATGAAGGASNSVTLKADGRGHFIAEGQVNGGSVRFLVDTGATAVALPAAEARRLGINYLKGERGSVQTANGTANAYRVKLDTVRLGDITLNNIDGVVLEGGLAMPLLGMTFLNRTEMKRDGETMVLTKRY